MNKKLDFRFSFEPLPPPGAEATTVEEGIQDLLKRLDARGGKCLDTLGNLADLYSGNGELDKASECLQRFIELTDDPEKLGLKKREAILLLLPSVIGRHFQWSRVPPSRGISFTTTLAIR